MIALALAASVAAPALMPPGFAGVAVVVEAASGRVIAGGPAGTVALEPRRRFDLTSRWRLASFTKQVVATLVMQSVEAKRLALDDDVSRWLPAFAGRGVTVRSLLTHRSGVAYPDASDAAVNDYYARDEAGQRAFCGDAPRAAAGGAVQYNNCDYVVLGALLERIERKPWFALVEQRVNRRAGTRFTLDDTGAYIGSFDGKREQPVRAQAFGAAGGLHGSVRDVIAFDRALMTGKLVSPASRAALWAGDPANGSVALGQWSYVARLQGCERPQAIVERRGQIGGVQLRNFIFPASGRMLVVLTDRGRQEFGEVWQGRGVSYDMASAAVCTGGPR